MLSIAPAGRAGTRHERGLQGAESIDIEMEEEYIIKDWEILGWKLPV